jgi:hypothetical protein
VVPERDVWVCLVDGAGRARVNGQVLTGGDSRGPFRSRRFEVTVGNGGGDLVIDGKRRNVRETAEPLGYSIDPDGVKVLSEADRPTCG